MLSDELFAILDQILKPFWEPKCVIFGAMVENTHQWANINIYYVLTIFWTRNFVSEASFFLTNLVCHSFFSFNLMFWSFWCLIWHFWGLPKAPRGPPWTTGNGAKWLEGSFGAPWSLHCSTKTLFRGHFAPFWDPPTLKIGENLYPKVSKKHFKQIPQRGAFPLRYIYIYIYIYI